MIAGRLLARGMVTGCIAAALAFVFARIFGEPQVDLAIAFEATRHAAEAAHTHMLEAEPVSRATQASYGLLTAVVLYGTAFGGIFSLVFAYAYGRLNAWSPRALALLLAGAGFVAFVLVPDLKYPPNPPAVGVPATLAFRTITYFAMIGLSVSVGAIATLIGQKNKPEQRGLGRQPMGCWAVYCPYSCHTNSHARCKRSARRLSRCCVVAL